ADVPPSEAGLLARGVMGIAESAAQWWLDQRSVPRDRVVKDLSDLAWRGLAGVPRRGEERVPAGRSYERRIRAKREAARKARRHAERMRKLRIGGSMAGAGAIPVILLIVFLSGGKPKPAASTTPSSTPTATGSPIAGCTEPSPAPTPNGKQYSKP